MYYNLVRAEVRGYYHIIDSFGICAGYVHCANNHYSGKKLLTVHFRHLKNDCTLNSFLEVLKLLNS